MDDLLGIERKPYEKLFPGFSLTEGQIGELNGWDRDFRDMYQDTMVMLEIERRRGVDFLDFQGGLFGFQRSLGQILEEEVREAKSRNPEFLRRGKKAYWGFLNLRHPQEWNTGFFLTEDGEDYLDAQRLGHDSARERLLDAPSAEACKSVLAEHEITQGEYVVQGELFRTGGGVISFRRTPRIFAEPYLGDKLYELLVGKQRDIEIFTEAAIREV